MNTILTAAATGTLGLLVGAAITARIVTGRLRCLRRKLAGTRADRDRWERAARLRSVSSHPSGRHLRAIDN